jgi:arylsulfatase A-like enzyme
MTRRLQTVPSLLCLTLIVLSLSATAAERPNFLLIVADDATWRDFGFTGNQDVKTPHLDRLASEGMQLTQMFTPATTCSPSRHALYTGLFPIRSGAYPNHTRVYDGTKSMFTYFKQLGYRVALQGKEHVGPAASFPYEHLGAKGFDGRSFLDVLTGKSDRLRDYVFSQHTTVGIIGYKEPYPMRAVRDARYKYIRNLAPQNTYEIGGIHKGEPIAS